MLLCEALWAACLDEGCYMYKLSLDIHYNMMPFYTVQCIVKILKMTGAGGQVKQLTW